MSKIQYKYQAIADQIRNKIINGEYKENQVIDDEKTLANKFSCSRMTMKQAMDQLVAEGYIVKSRGRGTLVKQQFKSLKGNKRYSNKPSTFGFNNTFTNDNKKSEVKLFEVIIAEDNIANILQIKKGSFVYHIERVRYLDDLPVIFETIYMSIDRITGLTEEILKGSLYKYIENELNLRIYNADKLIRAEIADEKDKEFLNIADGSTVIEVEHVVYGDDAIPLEYAIIHYSGDKFELHLISKKE
ncbi:GntR family transcriptional regulator [Clostridium sardiniense]|uniref:GntR family transcriptional regulator n=1 Tax=Clostridium sardiniense TaxID=29369 RepID=UPI003D3353B9